MTGVTNLLTGAVLALALQAQPALPIPDGWESVAMPQGVMPGWVAPKSYASDMVEGDRIVSGDFMTVQTNPAGQSFYVVTRFAANCDRPQLKKLSDRVFNAASQQVSDHPAVAPWINVYKDQTPAEYAVYKQLCTATEGGD